MSLRFRLPAADAGDKQITDAINALRDASMSGFFDLPCSAASDCSPSAATYFVVFGMGGSSLGARALVEALAPGDITSPRWFFIDNADPFELKRVLDFVPAESTEVFVTSKSGNTIEVLAQLDAADQWLSRALSIRVICGPGPHSIRRWAEKKGVEPSLFGIVPPAVGGRYSVLSDVGLWPAQAAGVDRNELLRGAKMMRDGLLEQGAKHPIARHAWLHAEETKQARSTHVLFAYSAAMRAFADWYVQLWSESLGKAHDQIHLPTALPAVGSRDQHSQLQLFADGPNDKVFTFLRFAESGSDLPIDKKLGTSMQSLLNIQALATADTLAKTDRPVHLIEADRLDAYHFGALVFFFEASCALTGFILGIDPFDQPGVEGSKVLTKARLSDAQAPSFTDIVG